MLARFIVRAIFAALGLWIAAQIVPGLRFDSLGSLIAAAVLLGGFHVNGLVPGVLGAIVTGLASWIGGMVMGDAKR